MNALTFTVRALEPLLIADLGAGDPNSARGFDFIPGSALRGALIGRYLNGQTKDAADPEFRLLFFDGAVCYLNAYPIRDGQRLLPAPLSWQREKDMADAGTIFDLAVEPVPASLQTPVVASLGFCRITEDEAGAIGVVAHQTARQVNIHTYREERARLAKGKSTVFRYDAIARGEVFGGAILADAASVFDALRPLIDGVEISLGKSHTAGYGRVRIDNVQVHRAWQEYQPAGEDTDNLIVTLLSDALIRNTEGSYGASLEPVIGHEHIAAFVGTRPIGGFNRTWGLPLPQAMAVRAGSVFVSPDSEDLRERLRALEQTGIGERRVEGFGRIAVNWHRAGELEPPRTPASADELMPRLQDELSVGLAQQMVERMWRVELDRALVAAVNRRSVDKAPANAQLSRMRVIARQALRDNDARPLLRHLAAMKRAASDQFSRARIDGRPLDQWLETMASKPESVWTQLQVGSQRRPSIGGLAATDTDALALEYAVRLIDGVLRKAGKERQR